MGDPSRTVVLGERPVELDALIARRQRLGLDLFDEMWEGCYHMAPAPRFGHAYLDRELSRVLAPGAMDADLVGCGPFNLGEPTDYRVPDGGFHRRPVDPTAVYLGTAAIVVEIVSPGDETYDKLPFYAARGVDEVIVAEPDRRQVRIYTLRDDRYFETGTSAILGVTTSDVETAIVWP